MDESAAEVASFREALRKMGYSEKAIEEVLKWYDPSQNVKTPQEK